MARKKYGHPRGSYTADTNDHKQPEKESGLFKHLVLWCHWKIKNAGTAHVSKKETTARNTEVLTKSSRTDFAF